MIKLVLVLGAIGHLICGFTDCLFTYGPNGKISLGGFKDYDKASSMMEGMSLKKLMLGIVLGVITLIISAFGYLGLCEWMKSFSPVYSVIMYISGVIYLLTIVAHHVFCGTAEWFFVRLGRTKQALDAVMDFFKGTLITMYIGYASMFVYSLALLIAVVTSKTTLPVWACIFNTIPLFLALMPTKLPAKGNIAGVVMFVGLAILI